MRKLLLLFFAVMGVVVFGQDQMIIESGNFDFLKDQTEVNVQVKFENVAFQIENYTEDQYLEKRKAETIAKKGEQAWGKWSEEWEKFKNTEYLQYFLQGVNKKSKKIAFKKDANTKYTLIVEAKWIYAGWHAGLVGQEAKLTSDLTFVETANPSNVVMKLKGDKVLGKPQNKDFVMEYGRIAGAYEQTGKYLGKKIKEVIKK